MVTSLLVALEKIVDAVARAAERAGPLVEQALALLRDPVAASGGPGRLLVPLGAHEALVFERAEEAVEVAHVRLGARKERGELVEELRAVDARPVADQQEHGRLREPLDARANEPATPV
jgi:hypothetical protein